jgi:hypothetical protein
LQPLEFYVTKFTPLAPLSLKLLSVNSLFMLCPDFRIQISHSLLTPWNIVLFEKLTGLQIVNPGPSLSLYTVRKRVRFHGELLAPRPTPKPEDNSFSAVRNCLFNIFAATLHIGGRSSIRNLRTRHAVVTGTHLSLTEYNLSFKSSFLFLFVVWAFRNVGLTHQRYYINMCEILLQTVIRRAMF